MKPEILIVEDDLLLAASVAADLEQNGFRISAKCVSGETALQSVEAGLPDLVLMDIKLKGGLDGIQVTERILKKYRVPIIYLTDLPQDEAPQQGRQTTLSSYLTKPFQTAQLITAVERALFRGSTAYIGHRFGFFKGNGEAIKVTYDDIFFLKSDRVQCEVVTKKGKFTLTQPLKTVCKKIPYPDLIRVSRSYAINKNHVDRITGHMIYVKDEKIKVGETYDHVIAKHFSAG